MQFLKQLAFLFLVINYSAIRIIGYPIDVNVVDELSNDIFVNDVSEDYVAKLIPCKPFVYHPTSYLLDDIINWIKSYIAYTTCSPIIAYTAKGQSVDLINNLLRINFTVDNMLTMELVKNTNLSQPIFL
jgi:hypothetical protein